VRWDLKPGIANGNGGDINLTDITLLIFGAASAPPMFGSAKAFNGPECTEVVPPGSPDLVAVDMDPSLVVPNTATSISTVETCARLNDNGITDADEDAVDTIDVDVVVEDIPPGPNWPNGGLGMKAFSYLLDYPGPAANLQLASANNSLLMTASSAAVLDLSDVAPETDGTYFADITKTIGPVPEDGDGTFSSFTFDNGNGALTPGVYALDLQYVLLIDDNGDAWPPLVEQDAQVAIGTLCP
jgi:hypothetical protein